MLRHYKDKQNNFRKIQKCGPELFKSVLEFSEITVLHGNVRDSNIKDRVSRKVPGLLFQGLHFGLIARHAVLR